MFQSSPGMGAGRNLLRWLSGPTLRVSILARHGSRAQPQIQLLMPITGMFQSSPGMGAGRNMDGIQSYRVGYIRFQSSPGMGAGRNFILYP